MSIKYYSPLRYPGGKGMFSYFFSEVIKNNLGVKYFSEPFAGGAAVSLSLLKNGFVEKIFLNDQDIFIYSFWKAIITKPDEFIKLIRKTPVTIGEWKKQNAFYRDPKTPKSASLLDIGFCTFFLNRCNRSGILNAGPIGGKEQTGEWKIDARFKNKESLINRIEVIKRFRNKINISRDDGIDYMKVFLNKNTSIPHKAILFYLDPPYYLQGKSLYKNNYYVDKDHKNLANHLNSSSLKWILSYDENKFIRNLYSNGSFQWSKSLRMTHLANKTKIGKELIIASNNCKIPLSKIKLTKSQLKPMS